MLRQKDLNEGLEPVREALKAMGKADALKLDDEGEDEKEAAAGGEASKASAVAHVVHRAAEIAIHILCIWFILRILCIAVLAISARWCIQWMGRASELPASIPPATRRGAFAKRLARRRASRAAKRAAAAAEWAQVDEALAASAFSRLGGSPSAPCSQCSPSARRAALLSYYVEWLRALGRERQRMRQPGCRLHSYLRRRYRKMILRKAQAAVSHSPSSPALAGIMTRPAVVTPELTHQSAAALAALELRARLAHTADALRQWRAAVNLRASPCISVDLRVRHPRVSVVRLRGGMQAAAPDADVAAAAMSSAMSELDPEVKRELSALDHDLLEAFGRGDIALVRSAWLLAQLALQPDFRIVRRQDLKPVGGISPHLDPEEAKRLLLKGERAIGAFSFGWPTSGNPDPTGHRIKALWRALQERSDIEALFWDFPSLYQNSDQSPRTEEQERAFKRGLGVMGHIYASAIGTTVLQLKELPLRPPEYDGKLC
eukprot:jgi/Chrpa1/18845/Chrysochromulina_OHIO_Genome00025256-RA